MNPAKPDRPPSSQGPRPVAGARKPSTAGVEASTPLERERALHTSKAAEVAALTEQLAAAQQELEGIKERVEVEEARAAEAAAATAATAATAAGGGGDGDAAEESAAQAQANEAAAVTEEQARLQERAKQAIPTLLKVWGRGDLWAAWNGWLVLVKPSDPWAKKKSAFGGRISPREEWALIDTATFSATVVQYGAPFLEALRAARGGAELPEQLASGGSGGGRGGGELELAVTARELGHVLAAACTSRAKCDHFGAPAEGASAGELLQLKAAAAGEVEGAVLTGLGVSSLRLPQPLQLCTRLLLHGNRLTVASLHDMCAVSWARSLGLAGNWLEAIPALGRLARGVAQPQFPRLLELELSDNPIMSATGGAGGGGAAASLEQTEEAEQAEDTELLGGDAFAAAMAGVVQNAPQLRALALARCGVRHIAQQVRTSRTSLPREGCVFEQLRFLKVREPPKEPLESR